MTSLAHVFFDCIDSSERVGTFRALASKGLRGAFDVIKRSSLKCLRGPTYIRVLLSTEDELVFVDKLSRVFTPQLR